MGELETFYNIEILRLKRDGIGMTSDKENTPVSSMNDGAMDYGTSGIGVTGSFGAMYDTKPRSYGPNSGPNIIKNFKNVVCAFENKLKNIQSKLKNVDLS